MVQDLEEISLTAEDAKKILSDKLKRSGFSDEQIRGNIMPENQILYSKFRQIIFRIGKNYDINLPSRDPELRAITTLEQAADYIAKKDAEKYEELQECTKPFYDSFLINSKS